MYVERAHIAAAFDMADNDLALWSKTEKHDNTIAAQKCQLHFLMKQIYVRSFTWNVMPVNSDRTVMDGGDVAWRLGGSRSTLYRVARFRHRP